MKLSIKKIIAREVLIILLIMAIGIISFLSLWIRNYYYQIKISNLNKEFAIKEKSADSLRTNYNKKVENQKWYFLKIDSVFDLPKYKTQQKFWNRIEQLSKSDTLKIIYNEKPFNVYNKKLGFESQNQYLTFINQNLLSLNDIKDKSQSDSLLVLLGKINMRKELYKKNNLNIKEILKATSYSIIIAFTIFFLVRYLFYCLKWSIKILKQKSEN